MLNMKYYYKTNVMSKGLYHVDTMEDFFRLVTILKIWLSYCLCLRVCQKSNIKKEREEIMISGVFGEKCHLMRKRMIISTIF